MKVLQPLFAISCLLGLSLAVPALADPPVAVDPALAGPVTLRYLFAPGTTDSYHIDMQQNVTMTGEALGGSASTAMNIQMDVTHAAQSVDEAGNGNVQQTLSGVTMTMDFNGQTMPMEEVSTLLNGLSMSMDMSPLGVTSNIVVGEVADPQMQQMFGMMSDSMGQMSIEFPEQQLNPGDTWTTNMPLDMGQQGSDFSATADATHTFLGFANLEGVNCAVIESTMTFNLSGSIDNVGVVATATGSGSGTGYTYFDATAGEVARGSMDMTLATHLAAEGMDMDQNITMTMNITKQP